MSGLGLKDVTNSNTINNNGNQQDSTTLGTAVGSVFLVVEPSKIIFRIYNTIPPKGGYNLTL